MMISLQPGNLPVFYRNLHRASHSAHAAQTVNRSPAGAPTPETFGAITEFIKVSFNLFSKISFK